MKRCMPRLKYIVKEKESSREREREVGGGGERRENICWSRQTTCINERIEDIAFIICA